MSKWLAVLVIIACLAALYGLWVLRDYNLPRLTRAFHAVMAVLFGWGSAMFFAEGWELGRLRVGCGRRAVTCSPITIDQNPIEFVFAMSLSASIFIIAFCYLFYLAWWLVLIVKARFR